VKHLSSTTVIWNNSICGGFIFKKNFFLYAIQLNEQETYRHANIRFYTISMFNHCWLGIFFKSNFERKRIYCSNAKTLLIRMKQIQTFMQLSKTEKNRIRIIWHIIIYSNRNIYFSILTKMIHFVMSFPFEELSVLSRAGNLRRSNSLAIADLEVPRFPCK